MRLDPITLSNSIPITTQPPSSHFAFGAYTATSGQVMLGGHSALDPLLPIPNRTVKRSCADDSAHTVCESRSPPGSPTKTPLRYQPRGVFFIRNRRASLWYNHIRRVSPHCRVVNLVRSGRKQPQPFTASAGGKARHFHFQATALRIVSSGSLHFF